MGNPNFLGLGVGWGEGLGRVALRASGPQQRRAPAHVETPPQQGGTAGLTRAYTSGSPGSGSCPHPWGGPFTLSLGTFPLISAPWVQRQCRAVFRTESIY